MNESPRAATPDFLDRIVDKAIGTDDAMQPHLPSFYEPVTGPVPSAAADWRADIDSPVAEVADRPSQQAPRDAPLAPRDLPTESPPPQAGRERVAAVSADELTPPVPTRPQPRTTALPTLTPIAANLEAQHGVAMPLAEEGLATPRRSPTLSQQPAPIARDAPAHHEAPVALLQAASHPSIAPPRASDGNVLDDPRMTHEGRQELPPVRAEVAARGALIPAAAPVAYARAGQTPGARWQTSALQGSRPPDADSPPVVNVTIGRIEVRTVQAPSAAPRQRTEPRAPKPMSLDDYLKQRGSVR